MELLLGKKEKSKAGKEEVKRGLRKFLRCLIKIGKGSDRNKNIVARIRFKTVQCKLAIIANNSPN